MALEISLRHIFQDFNHPKVVVYSSLLLFFVLFALKEDKSIDWPYWAVFMPLWIWKALALSGGITGCVVFKSHPPNRNDFSSHIEYRVMILSCFQQFLLLLFEILVCFKLDTNYPIIWLLIFTPLLCECLIAVPICVWSLKRDRSYGFEFVFAANLLQFVFIALKLDEMLNWPWVITFIPIWILICLCLMVVIYAIVSAVLLIRSVDLMAEHRRQSAYSAMNHTLLVVPILIFLVLLTNKLDGESHVPYFMIYTPLYVSLICLLILACGTKGGNQWWFGMRREFCQFLLSVCPFLREYGNVSYRFSDSSSGRPSIIETDAANNKQSHLFNKDQQKQSVVVVLPNSIDCPD